LAAVLARSKTTTAAREATVALTAEAGDLAVSLTVPSDYGGTAMAAVVMTRTLLARDAPDYGVVLPFQLIREWEAGKMIERFASPDTNAPITVVIRDRGRLLPLPARRIAVEWR
jgi:hypothetical protein